MKDSTLCYIFRGEDILLQKKAPGLFGAEKWNAPGGKVKFAESPEKTAKREVKEETGLIVNDIKNVGVLNFMEEGGKWFAVHVFKTSSYSGEMKDSQEGKLKWFSTKNLPYEEMWSDDKIWLPHLLANKTFQGAFLFDKGFKNMLKHDMIEVDS